MGFIRHSDRFDALLVMAKEIEQKQQAYGREALSEKEKAVDVLLTAFGLIENGSFQYFFECGGDAMAVADACWDIGAPEAAKCFVQADFILKRLPSSASAKDRMTHLLNHEKELDALATLFLEHTLETENRLFQYITSGKSAQP